MQKRALLSSWRPDNFIPLPERESREHEEPTTSEMTEETYPPKAYRPKHGRLSELKAEALKKDRRKKLTLAKFVGMAENTAHPRVVIPELRQEFELVSAFSCPRRGSRGQGAAGGLCRMGSGCWWEWTGKLATLTGGALLQGAPLLTLHLLLACRAPAAGTWRHPCRSSRAASGWFPALSISPTVTERASTRGSR